MNWASGTSNPPVNNHDIATITPSSYILPNSDQIDPKGNGPGDTTLASSIDEDLKRQDPGTRITWRHRMGPQTARIILTRMLVELSIRRWWLLLERKAGDDVDIIRAFSIPRTCWWLINSSSGTWCSLMQREQEAGRIRTQFDWRMDMINRSSKQSKVGAN